MTKSKRGSRSYVYGMMLFAIMIATSEAHATDLSMDKYSVDCSVAPGATLNYTIVIRNDTTVDGLNAVLTDTVPAGLNIIDITTTQGTCFQDELLQNDVTCSLGSISAGGTVTVTIQVQVQESLALNTDITNTATVTADNEINQSNNSDSSDTIVVGEGTQLCEEVRGLDSGGCSLVPRGGDRFSNSW